MDLEIVPVTPFQQNCSLLVCPESGEAAVVDPGGDVDRILSSLEALGATARLILVTHGHIDHIGGVSELAARLHLPVLGPQQEDRFLVEGLPRQVEMFGLEAGDPFEPDRWLEEGDVVEVGRCRLEVRHCPGHTPGHLVFHDPEEGLVVVGDVMFRGAIGRTDLPRGDYQALLRSIREKLLTLPDDTRVVPGHGPLTTIGEERATNPWLRKRV